ncbi:transcription intermediary factor 1-beta-like [Watersipora subatra]|uniref:transcription intermediary factor 1-beta-like n=1 Tax=Watersipora subatra TaxID=2589382 RepID=UPI00355C419F
MAKALEHSNMPVECGYCMMEGDQLVDPRTLPCQHIHCYPCLVAGFDTNRIVGCGKCKEVFDVTISRLPSAIRRDGDLHNCDVCVQKGKANELAVTYCCDCKKKICTKHVEPHEEFFPEHKELLKIEEYQQKARMYDVRKCTRHEDKPIAMGCSSCYKVLCVDCMDGSKECDEGMCHWMVHQSMSLKELIKLLKVKRDDLKVEAQVKDGELSVLLKDATKVLSDYERKTEKLIKQLHSIRDEQLSELRRKYDNLERELLENRNKSKEQLIEFMEREIGLRMTEINTLLLIQDARFRDAHQVDIAEGYATTANELKRFIDEDLPSFKLTNQKALSALAEAREIELKMVDAAAIPVSQLLPPTSLKFKNIVNNVGQCYTVCQYDGFTYVGGGGSTVYKIDESDSSVTSFSSIKGIQAITALCVCNDKLYILTHPGKVVVTDMNATQISSWVHPDECTYVNKLVVTGEKVVVPVRSNKRLTVYSLDGQVIKHIPCLQDGEWGTMALYAPDHESVVVSSHNTSKVFRVNIETGEVMWTSTAVTYPGGVACYTKKYILVTPLRSDPTEIHILHADTGHYIGKLVDTEKRGSSGMPDLYVTGDTLIVPRMNQKTVLYYQLLSE